MRSIIAVTVMSLTASFSNCAKADCDTGFEMRTLIGQPHQKEIVFFQCVVGGLYGDPDLGWEMVHLTAPNGEEIRVHSRDAQKLLQVGLAVAVSL